MAIITLTIPDAQLTRVVAALCTSTGVPPTNANAKQVVVDFVKTTVRFIEYNAATAAQPPLPQPDVSGIVS